MSVFAFEGTVVGGTPLIIPIEQDCDLRALRVRNDSTKIIEFSVLNNDKEILSSILTNSENDYQLFTNLALKQGFLKIMLISEASCYVELYGL